MYYVLYYVIYISDEQYDNDNTLRKLAIKKVQEIKGDRSILSRKSKLYRFLVQKGYERDLVMDLVKELI